MHRLVENNKGFTTLEVIVVLCIVGVLAAISYPRISDWNKARAVQSDVLKAFNVFDKISWIDVVILHGVSVLVNFCLFKACY